MNSLFSFTNKCRSDLGREEVLGRIDDLLKTKSRFLFTLTRHKFDWWGMMSSRLKGRVFNQDGTILHMRITIPWVIVTIFLFAMVNVLFAILKADEMAVNGEIREADFSLKAMMVLLVFVFPACMIFATAILPAKLMERKIVKLLELVKVHDQPTKPDANAH